MVSASHHARGFVVVHLQTRGEILSDRRINAVLPSAQLNGRVLAPGKFGSIKSCSVCW